MGRQKVQTAEILKASYFSSKHISPEPEALGHPWNIPDLTLPLFSPSYWSSAGPSILMALSSSLALPVRETKWFFQGAGLVHSFQSTQDSQEGHSWLWLAVQLQGGQAGTHSLAGRTLPSSEHACQLLSEATLLFGMALPPSVWCW